MTPSRRFRCSGCGHVYDEEKGDPHEGFPPGTRWSEVPEDWACPDCAVREKPDFAPEMLGVVESPVANAGQRRAGEA